MREERIYTVSEITEIIRGLFEREFELPVSIRGEISNLDRSQRGHFYFTLKDSGAQIRAVLYKGRARNYLDMLKNGVEVVCTGFLEVYAPRGEYQVNVLSMKRVGLGALYLEFERLKKLLEKEGLFDEAYKKPIPLLPRRIGIVTSPEGAAIRDIIRIIRESGYGFQLIIYPSHVQGAQAAKEIVEGIRFFNQMDVDLIVLARGGGSIEDLWAFNEEIVARAIFESEVPVISAVGHERDYTISDFVADHRCATPTHVAAFLVERERRLREFLRKSEMLMNRRIQNLLSHYRKDLVQLKKILTYRDPRRRVSEAIRRLDELTDRMHRAVFLGIGRKRDRLVGFRKLLDARSPVRVLKSSRDRLTDLEGRLIRIMKDRIEARNNRLRLSLSKLEVLSPRKVLSRGYAICYYQGRVVKDVNQLPKNALVFVELAKGAMECRVQRKRPLYTSC